jgi:hypothetical protein
LGHEIAGLPEKRSMRVHGHPTVNTRLVLFGKNLAGVLAGFFT